MIGTTDDHPFWVVGKGWVTTIELSIGDQIETADGGIVVVEQIVFTERIEETYNIEVADYHTYYVTELGIWVHNSDKCVTKAADLNDGTSLKTDDALNAALDHLGDGYKEIAPGVFKSKDGTKLLRMTDSDIAKTNNHAGAPHLNFETRKTVVKPNGKESFVTNEDGNKHIFLPEEK